MYLSDDPRPPLAEWVTDAYTVLADHMMDSETVDGTHQVPSIERTEAIDVLCAADELALQPEDARYAITRLLERGYLYEVDGELRITSPSAE